MSETIRIADLSVLISKEIADFLKWTIHLENDLNHKCLMPDKHFQNTDKNSSKTHPTDLAIYYTDPLENKTIFLNTDLKSYAKDSIGYAAVREWLKSIAKGTVCCNMNPEWKQTYQAKGNYEIRGLLYVYNHDGLFDKPFYDLIHDYPEHTPHTTKKAPKRFNLSELEIPPNIKLHIIEPILIDNILSIKHDLDSLRSTYKVPSTSNSVPINFYYPNRQMSKNLLKPDECPATIELISGPFFIMNYDNYSYWENDPDNSDKPLKINKNRGNIIYYKETGASVEEFLYLIETLMMFELIHENCDTYIRHCSRTKSGIAKHNFDDAINQYCKMWDYSENMKSIFKKIDYQEVTIVQKIFCNQKIDRSTKEQK